MEFPLRLYKGNPYFVPPLYMDEKKIFDKNYVYADTCEYVCYLAVDEAGKTVGRINAILQKASNRKTGEKRVRFTRFDAINDQAVATALFNAAEDWARSKGMDTVCGPLGFSDLEREGLLIEGFDELATFEEQYNYDYYPALIEACGYKKEVDWLERKILKPKKLDERLINVSSMILKKYNLKFAECKNVNEFIDRYADKFFALLDKSYDKLYGTVPFTDGMKKMMIDNFRLIIDLRFVTVIVDENDNVVCLGICFPSLSKVVQPSQGKLTIPMIFRLLKAKKNPKIIDLGLVGVEEEYANKGVSSAMFAGFMKMLYETDVEYAETNLNLEDNYAILNQWRRFDSVQHKRRRSYIKKLN